MGSRVLGWRLRVEGRGLRTAPEDGSLRDLRGVAILLGDKRLECGVGSVGFRVWGSGCGVQGAVLRVQGLGCGVQGAVLRGRGFVCGVSGVVFRVWGAAR